MTITTAQFQSLIARNAEDIRRVLKEIQGTAEMLAPSKYKADDYNKPFYAILTKLQRKRAKLEQLQRDLREDMKLMQERERAVSVLVAAGFTSTAKQILFVSHVPYPQ